MFKSPQEARDLMKIRFENNDPDAIYFYAITYQSELKVLNNKLILNLWTQAYEAGHARAAIELGDYHRSEYWNNRNPEEDQEIEIIPDITQLYYKTGYERFLKKALEGDNIAMRDISQCYQNGWGVEVDEEQTIIWLEKAFKAGNSAAALDLYDTYRWLDLEKAKPYFDWLQSNNIPCAPYGKYEF